MPTVVYLSHREQRCGVYQFGYRIGAALASSKVFDFRYRECENADDLERVFHADRPVAIVYNYHPATLPWITPEITRRFKTPQIGTIHEITQAVADQADDTMFDLHICPDPTLLLKNPLICKTGRLVEEYDNPHPQPEIPTIGSFGFGLDGKGIEYLVALVQESFDAAILRLHLPNAKFGDDDGAKVRAIVSASRALVYKPGIRLEFTHEFMDEARLLDFLAQNSCNAFLYNRAEGRGISSAIDYALSVKRPIAIRRTTMMRHLWEAMPSICVEDRSLAGIIEAGIEPLKPFAERWCARNLVWEYEQAVRKALASGSVRPKSKPTRAGRLLRRARDSFNYRVRGITAPPPTPSPQARVNWIRDTSLAVDTSTWHQPATYLPVDLNHDRRLNRILDDSARHDYRQTIAQLYTWFPDLMARKISRANVQQAFGLDTVVRLAGNIGGHARILCVGSFEDSTCWGLKRLGFRVDEIDPMLNEELSEFLNRPTTSSASWDIVFSISVIEHVEDDETFLVQAASLLKPGGYLVITCDYNDSYAPGDPKPGADCRLYSQADLRNRLLPKVPDLVLVDEPRWDCPNPDFAWDDFHYTFAAITLKKK